MNHYNVNNYQFLNSYNGNLSRKSNSILNTTSLTTRSIAEGILEKEHKSQQCVSVFNLSLLNVIVTQLKEDLTLENFYPYIVEPSSTVQTTSTARSIAEKILEKEHESQQCVSVFNLSPSNATKTQLKEDLTLENFYPYIVEPSSTVQMNRDNTSVLKDVDSPVLQRLNETLIPQMIRKISWKKEYETILNEIIGQNPREEQTKKAYWEAIADKVSAQVKKQLGKSIKFSGSQCSSKWYRLVSKDNYSLL